MTMKRLFLFFALAALMSPASAQRFIAEVLEYVPAPGQFVNGGYGTPEAAQSVVGGTQGMLSLGSFGGYVVFRFDGPVRNHPDNPYGVDFTLFGNPMPTWSEPAVVWVMRDDNGNGLPDDTWYQLAGSDHFFSSTRRGLQVTYANPGPGVGDVAWVDSDGLSGEILALVGQAQSLYPLPEFFPGIGVESYTLGGTMLRSVVDMRQPTFVKAMPRAFGYADNLPRGSAPFDLPDNPYTAEKENAGADAFDIAWAIDAEGEYVDLDEVHFIKVQSATLANAGWTGEISTELTGGVAVSPVAGSPGPGSTLVAAPLPDTVSGGELLLEAAAFAAGRRAADAQVEWTTDAPGVVIEGSVARYDQDGPATFTASWQGHTATASTYLRPQELSTQSAGGGRGIALSVWPSPTSGSFAVGTERRCDIAVYDATGRLALRVGDVAPGGVVDIAALPAGLYLVAAMADGRPPRVARIAKR